MTTYSDLIEKEHHGTNDFPMEFYHLEDHHLRYEMTLHWHPEMELIRVLDGCLELHLNKDTYCLKAGDLAIVNPGTLHRGEPRSCVYDCAVFKPDMLFPSGAAVSRYIKPVIGQLSIIQPYFAANSTPELTDTVDQLFDALSKCPPFFELSVYSALYRLFFVLYQIGAIAEQKNRPKQEKQLSHLMQLLSWIDEHYTQRITLSELAKYSGLNEKYLCRFFKEYTNNTPIDYINRLRVEKAADDLLTKHLSVTEAAFTNGFNDSAYFAKVFRQIKGSSPSEWKKQGERFQSKPRI